MNIKVYAVADTALNSDELVGYTFNVVMSHDDGKKTILGDYSVSTDDEITGSVFYEHGNDTSSINRIKEIILSKGLEDVVADAEEPRKYFWKDHIAFPPSSNTQGAFQRAEALYNSDKVIKTTHEDYMTMMEYSEGMDLSYGSEPDPFEGIDFDEGYDDYDESGIGSARS